MSPSLAAWRNRGFAAEQSDTGTVDQATLQKVFPSKPGYSPYAGRTFPTMPLFGDTHLHTGYSMDAGAFGARLTPRDAYRFARGEEIASNTGQPEVGLPQASIPTALLFFNVGVEIGQLLFITLVLALVVVGLRVSHRLALTTPGWLWRVPPYAIGGLASFWAVQRISTL